MTKSFNVTGACNPELHYMVNIDDRLQIINRMIDKGNYFTINRARQYGKTTTLGALGKFLQDEYVVIHLDFQMLSYEVFSSEASFVSSFVKSLLRESAEGKKIPQDIAARLSYFTDPLNKAARLSDLFPCLGDWCAVSRQPVVLMIDEADNAANNQIFIDFLSQIRAYFNANRTRKVPAFQSVIFAGVHDIKHLKIKIRENAADQSSENDSENNSPWNIATDFLLDMSFDPKGIAGMLLSYENDHHTGMDTEVLAELIYEYTSGYPYLVSRICNIIDERLVGSKVYPTMRLAWSRSGFLEAIKILQSESNSLFDSLLNKLNDYPELNQMLYEILFQGRDVPYTVGFQPIEDAEMFGFVRKAGGNVAIANRIFETLLYNLFLTTPEAQRNKIYKAALQDKNQFIQDNKLNMRLVLDKFVTHFSSIYGEHPDKFLEEDGRKYFLLYLKPIINGAGNYYIEPQTRDSRRSDVIIDYNGEQFIVELKLWRGAAYHTQGEKQLMEYMDNYQLKCGYLLTFNFNEKKESGIKEIISGDKTLIEAMV